MNLTLTERYLAGYHDKNPGVTARSFAARHGRASASAQRFAAPRHNICRSQPARSTWSPATSR